MRGIKSVFLRFIYFVMLLTFFLAPIKEAFAPPSGNCSDTPITITGVVSMDFDTIDGVVGTGTIDMGTNASIAYGAGYSGPGTGVAGQFTVNATKNCDVSIECSSTMILSDGGGGTVTIDSIEIVDKNGKPFGTGTACAGIGTPVVTGFKIGNNAANNTFLIGGSIDGTSGIPADSGLSTSASGGSSMTIDVTYDDP